MAEKDFNVDQIIAIRNGMEKLADENGMTVEEVIECWSISEEFEAWGRSKSEIKQHNNGA